MLLKWRRTHKSCSKIVRLKYVFNLVILWFQLIYVLLCFTDQVENQTQRNPITSFNKWWTIKCGIISMRYRLCMSIRVGIIHLSPSILIVSRISMNNQNLMLQRHHHYDKMQAICLILIVKTIKVPPKTKV